MVGWMDGCNTHKTQLFGTNSNAHRRKRDKDGRSKGGGLEFPRIILINFVTITLIARGSLLIARGSLLIARGSLFDKRSFP